MMTNSVTRPKCLKAGDFVGVVAPSSPPFESGQLQFSLAWLERLGLKAKISDQVLERRGDFAGSDQARVEALHTMWADPEIAAVMAVRGGNGGARILSMLDYSLFAKQPKILLGFSDISALLIAIHQKTGLITFHGPTFGAFFESAYTYEWFCKAMLECSAIGDIEDPADLSDLGPTYPPARLVISPGTAHGQLIGGNLTVLKQLMGTPFEIDTRGKILFMEEVGEEPHTIDRMLAQLHLSGKLEQAAGIIFGESIDCRPGDSGRNSSQLNYSVEQILRLRLGHLGIPVVYGLRFGHAKQKFTLPLGVMAHLSAEFASDRSDRSDGRSAGHVRFSIEEPATCPSN